MFHLLGDLRDRLAHRPPDVIGNRNTANLRQVLIYHQVTAIGTEKCQANRRRFVNECKFGRDSQRLARIGISDAALHDYDLRTRRIVAA